MDKISEAIERFAQRERDEAEKACKEEKNQVSINPDSYIAKEIKYQTALIHGMQEEMRLLRNKEIIPRTQKEGEKELIITAHDHTDEIFDNLETEEANEIIEEILQVLKKHEVTVGDADHLLDCTKYTIRKEIQIK